MLPSRVVTDPITLLEIWADNLVFKVWIRWSTQMIEVSKALCCPVSRSMLQTVNIFLICGEWVDRNISWCCSHYGAYSVSASRWPGCKYCIFLWLGTLQLTQWHDLYSGSCCGVEQPSRACWAVVQLKSLYFTDQSIRIECITGSRLQRTKLHNSKSGLVAQSR